MSYEQSIAVKWRLGTRICSHGLNLFGGCSLSAHSLFAPPGSGTNKEKPSDFGLDDRDGTACDDNDKEKLSDPDRDDHGGTAHGENDEKKLSDLDRDDGVGMAHGDNDETKLSDLHRDDGGGTAYGENKLEDLGLGGNFHCVSGSRTVNEIGFDDDVVLGGEIDETTTNAVGHDDDGFADG
ncbi:MAG: hypothetical protein Q9226_006116 [Calogaya cf. arnoldii]